VYYKSKFFLLFVVPSRFCIASLYDAASTVSSIPLDPHKAALNSRAKIERNEREISLSRDYFPPMYCYIRLHLLLYWTAQTSCSVCVFGPSILRVAYFVSVSLRYCTRKREYTNRLLKTDNEQL